MRFIDANVFVYAIAGDPTFGVRARHILERLERGEAAVISTLVISQVCAYLIRRRRPDGISGFLDLLHSLPALEKVDTTYGDFVMAAEIQESTGEAWTSWDDLVIAAQMRRLSISEIYSNDADFDRLPGMKRMF